MGATVARLQAPAMKHLFERLERFATNKYYRRDVLRDGGDWFVILLLLYLASSL